MYELSDEFLLNRELKHYRCSGFFIDILHDKEILIGRNTLHYGFEYSDDDCGFESYQFKTERDVFFALDEFCNSIVSNRSDKQFDISGIGLSIDEYEIKNRLCKKLKKDNYRYHSNTKCLLNPFSVSKQNNMDNTYIFNCELSVLNSSKREIVKTVIVDGKEYSRKEYELPEKLVINIDVVVEFIITKSYLNLYSRR